MQTAHTRTFGLVVALLTALTTAPAWAQPADQAKADEEARVHFRLGVAYHDSGRFDEAAREFQKAYDLSRRPKLLYNLFLAQRDGGHIAEAADALERYLQLEENVPERDKLTARLEGLKRIQAEKAGTQAPATAEEEPAEPQPGKEPPAEEPPVVEAPEEGVAATSPEPQMERNPWHRYAPWVTLGAGVAMAGAGAAVGAIAMSEYNDCESGSCSPSKLDAGTTKTRLADALIFGGGAVAVTGVVLYFLLPRERKIQTSSGVACSAAGCTAHLTHRF